MISRARISSVKSVPGKPALQVEFADGKHYDVDLREHIRQFPVLSPWRTCRCSALPKWANGGRCELG